MATPITLLSAATTVAAGQQVGMTSPPFVERAIQSTLTGTGAITATVKVQVSNDNVNWLDWVTFTHNGTTLVSEGYVGTSPYLYVRGNVTAISGTGAAVTLIMGVP